MISDENAVKESTEEDIWAAAAESARGYTFVVWDWKQQIDVEELNAALQKIPGAVVTEVVPPPGSFEDEYVLAVHSQPCRRLPRSGVLCTWSISRKGRNPMPPIEIEPVSLLGIVGAELFNTRIREMAAQCDTRRKFNRAMENEILPSIRALFDDRVAHDVLRAAREVYGMRGAYAKRTARRETGSGTYFAWRSGWG